MSTQSPNANNGPDRDLWQIAPGRLLDCTHPHVMAILNITPDSFHDGGQLSSPARAAEHAQHAIKQGATLLDIGGESTRPGADRINAAEQLGRVLPVIHEIRSRAIQTPISIDTTLAEVAERALDAGADIINDVAAGTEDDQILHLAAERSCGLILMHRRTTPDQDAYSDQYAHEPDYTNVTAAVKAFHVERSDAAAAAGVQHSQLLLDPGLGFGKSVDQNLQLIRQTPHLLELGRPILSAASRKSFLGRVALDRDSDPSERLPASIAATIAHYHAGARIFRVHDPAPHAQALRIIHAISNLPG